MEEVWWVPVAIAKDSWKRRLWSL